MNDWAVRRDTDVEFRADELARQVEAFHAEPLAAAGRSFRLLVGLGCEVPRLGDPFRLREVLDILLNPAAGSGPVEVAVRGREGQPLVIEISGAGPLTEAARALVAHMAGEIGTAGVGSGRRLRLTLPFDTPATTPAVVTSPGQPVTTGEFHKLRLLIADDSPTNLMVMREMLASTGAEITAVSDGQQVVEAWRDRPFDMLLLDIAMPVMDGLTALRTIRAEEEARGTDHLPAIAVTANVMSHQVEEYILGGFDTLISKPFRRHELIDAIAALRPAD